MWSEIAQLFRKNGYMWRFKKTLRYPTPKEIEQRAIALNATLQDNEQAENGRLILRKDADTTYVYVMIGEIEND
jgi:hypothetical protein